MNLDVVPGPWTSEDLIYELGILRGLPHGNPEQQTRCSACNLWRGNPLKRFQSLLSTARKARPISLLYSVERWNSGRELGCVLCQLVSLAVADTSGSARPQCNAAQLSITPIRRDFLHGIFVLGLSGQEGRWKADWQVELYATTGTKQPCSPSVLPAFRVTFDLSEVFVSLTLLRYLESTSWPSSTLRHHTRTRISRMSLSRSRMAMALQKQAW